MSVLIFALATIGLQHSTGEVLPRFEGLSADFLTSLVNPGGLDLRPRAWFRRSAQRQQLLAFVIGGHEKKIAARVLRDMGRGVTVLSGRGAYTGAARQVLMIALTVTEIQQLKTIIAEEDPSAFVIVSPAQSVFGKGFQSLKNE